MRGAEGSAAGERAGELRRGSRRRDTSGRGAWEPKGRKPWTHRVGSGKVKQALTQGGREMGGGTKEKGRREVREEQGETEGEQREEGRERPGETRDQEGEGWKLAEGEGRRGCRAGRQGEAGGGGPGQGQLTKLADKGQGLGAVIRGSPLGGRASPDVATGARGSRGLPLLPVAVAHV